MPDELDRFLDEALSTYAGSTGPSGLERRVLARVAQHQRAKARWPAFATAAGALATVVLVLSPAHHPRSLQIVNTAVPQKAIPVFKATRREPKPTAAPAQTRRSRALLDAACTTCLPHRNVDQLKLARFPTPAPLSPEERALLELARSQPAELAQLRKPIEPIDVPPIQVEPLDKEEN